MSQKTLPQTQTPFSQACSQPQVENEAMRCWGVLKVAEMKFRRKGGRPPKFQVNWKESLVLCQESISIGISEEADLTITDKHAPRHIFYHISRNQCKISKDCSRLESPVFIEDLSKNGTFLNGELIANEKCILKAYDVISFVDPTATFLQLISLPQDRCGLPEAIFEPYHIANRLGDGAQGKVRLIIDRKTCKAFALKIVKRTSCDSNSQILTVPTEKIIKEEEIVSTLDHPNIIKCDTFKIYGHYIYMFLEYMEGGDLLHRIQSEKYLSLITTKHFFLQLCGAVKYLHDNGYIHRDIKPDNILLQSGDDLTNLKISDFGLCKKASKNSKLNTFCGTPAYMAPGRRPFATNYDATIYNKTSGDEITYDKTTGDETTDDGRTFQPIAAGKLHFEHAAFRHVPEEAKDLLQKMLTFDPNQRPSIDEVLMHPWLSDKNLDGNELNEEFDPEIAQPPSKRRRIQ